MIEDMFVLRPMFFCSLVQSCERRLPRELEKETISLFFIELLLFEEAAIHIANQVYIVSLFTDSDFSEPVAFLKNVEAIYDDYSKSCAFWNIQLNYPTSQKSIDMMREAFEIEKQLADNGCKQRAATDGV